MSRYKTEVFRYDDLNWSEAEIEKVKQEAEALRSKHQGSIEPLGGHVSRTKGMHGEQYYAIPEHWPGLLVIWEEDQQADNEELDCDSDCVGCERACADRIPSTEPKQKNMK